MISSDFETFLKMLTAQLENQDPLNPLEATDFAVQLATFSGVEQQVRTNDLLSGLASQFGLSGMSNLAGWIGREARAAVPAVFDGDPVQLETRPEQGAVRAELVVRDSSGAEVESYPIPVAGGEITWTGLTPAGTARPWDTYSFAVESYDAADDLMTSVVPEIFAPVTEVRLVDGAPTLVLKGGQLVRPEQVGAVRSP
jgi:flagellar basal-body rod modification protein FlgD